MKITKTTLLVMFFLALGLITTSCAKLNPNTEGQLKAALEAKSDAFRACYETALEKNREEKGTVGLKLGLGADSGAVESSEVADTTIKDDNMNQCVADSASDISLEEPPGVSVEGQYDIEFSHK